MDRRQEDKMNRFVFDYFVKILFLFYFFSFSAFSMEIEYIGDSGDPIGDKAHLSELTPLVALEENDSGGHLYSYIQKYHVQQEDIPESTPKKVVRFGGQGVAIVLGGLAGIPYFEVARKAGGDNAVLSWGVGITNTVATSGTGAWSYFNLLKGLDPQSEEEKILLQDSSLPVTGHLAAHGLGLVVAVPTAYMASLFNTHKWLAGISYLLDYSLKTSGYLNFFKKVNTEKGKIKSCLGIENQEVPDMNSSLSKTQQLLVHHLSQKVIPALLTMSDEERDQFIELIYQEDNLKAGKYLESLFKTSSSNSSEEETPDTWKKGYPKLALISGLSFSAVLNIFHNGICGYKAWEMVYDHPAFAIPMAALSTIPIFILEMQATVETGRLLYDAAFYRLTGKPQPSLFNTLYPTFSRVLPLACIPLAAVTAYVGRYMVMDILQEVLPQEGPRLFFAIGGFMGPFLFAAYANHTLIHDLLISYTCSFGQIGHKKLTYLTQNIEKLTKIMSLTKKEQIQSFIEHPDIQNCITMLNNEETREESSQDQD